MTENICRLMYENFSKLLKDMPRERAFYDWMLANGKDFKGRKLTHVEEEMLQRRVSKKLYTLGMCILQSQVGCCNGGLHYYEGQATTESLGVPLEHAWLVDAEGKVWDATWKDGADYFGVEIPTAYVRKNMLETGEAQGLLAKYYAKEVRKNGKKKN